MDYVFGTNTINGELTEILKTVGDEFTDLSGFCSHTVETEKGTITHNYKIKRKYQEYVDNLGKHCSFYTIDSHTKDVDNTEWIKQQIAEQSEAINQILVLLLGE